MHTVVEATAGLAMKRAIKSFLTNVLIFNTRLAFSWDTGRWLPIPYHRLLCACTDCGRWHLPDRGWWNLEMLGLLKLFWGSDKHMVTPPHTHTIFIPCHAARSRLCKVPYFLCNVNLLNTASTNAARNVQTFTLRNITFEKGFTHGHIPASHL